MRQHAPRPCPARSRARPAVLRAASPDSLVLLDELGRGTSTHDGCAIAAAVLAHCAALRCRTLFSTHYHNLVGGGGAGDGVAQGHMGCRVDGAGAAQRVTFLYALRPGACPKSYGLNVARLAGVPEGVITDAAAAAERLEAAHTRGGLAALRDAHAAAARTALRAIHRGDVAAAAAAARACSGA